MRMGAAVSYVEPDPSSSWLWAPGWWQLQALKLVKGCVQILADPWVLPDRIQPWE